MFGNFVCGQSRTWNLDHRTDQDIQFASVLATSFHRIDRFLNLAFEQFQFRGRTDQRNHDFSDRIDPFLLAANNSFDDGSNLHLQDFRIGDTQTAATMPQHRVEFVELFNSFFHD